MKMLYTVWAILCPIFTALFFENSASAQCGNRPERSVSYDTSLAGFGNDEFILTFPQFDPTLGNLNFVRIETLVTLIYGFELESNDTKPSLQKVRVSRTDEITYPWAQIVKTLTKPLGPYPLAASDGVAGSGPDYIKVDPVYIFRDSLNTYNITDNVTAFLGNGNVDINYTTFSVAGGNVNSSLRGQAQDLSNFRITYFYCQTSFLASDIMQFMASKLPAGEIKLSWLTPNDKSGKRYEIQKSADGEIFKNIQSLVTGNNPSGSKLIYYHPAKEDQEKIFFRVRQIEADGSSIYSAVRQVALTSTEATMKVFPTLATNTVNIYFPPAAKGDYKVSIISTTGQVVQQSDFSKSNFIRVPFTRKLPSGMYIIAVYNKKTMQTQQSKIIVQ